MGSSLDTPYRSYPHGIFFNYSAIVEGCSVKIFCYVADVWNNFPAILLPWYGMVWYGRMVVQIIPWYGELKPENIPGIVERGGIRYPMPKIFQKKYSTT